MIFKGLIEDVFHNVTIFRGFASLQILASMSKANRYQRDVDTKHIEQISKYFKDSPFLFFPELIFSLQFEDQNAIKNIKYTEFSRGGLKTLEGIRIKKGKFTYEKKNENETSAKFVSFDIPDNLIDQKIFYRLDGNHRLSVIDKMIKDERENGYHNPIVDNVVPFSILLQAKGEDAQKYESAYFYLINSKSKPLTTEENLKAILSNPSFTDIDRESLLNTDKDNVPKINEIIEKFDNNAGSLKMINDIFNNEIYSLTNDLLPLISNISAEKVFEALEYVNKLYTEDKIEKSLPFVYKALIAYKFEHDEKDLLKFFEWLQTTKTNQIDFSNIKKLLESYEKNFNKVYKVFVATPYVSHKRIVDINKLFKEVLEELSKNQPYKLELIPIMHFRGESQRIDQRLIQKIKECDIFIADVSDCNSNVIFEIGLAEGNDKPKILIKAEEDKRQTPFDEAKILKKQIPFDMDKLQYIPYSETGYYNDIKSIMKNNIPEILVNRFGLIRKAK